MNFQYKEDAKKTPPKLVVWPTAIGLCAPFEEIISSDRHEVTPLFSAAYVEIQGSKENIEAAYDALRLDQDEGKLPNAFTIAHTHPPKDSRHMHRLLVLLSIPTPPSIEADKITPKQYSIAREEISRRVVNTYPPNANIIEESQAPFAAAMYKMQLAVKDRLEAHNLLKNEPGHSR